MNTVKFKRLYEELVSKNNPLESAGLLMVNKDNEFFLARATFTDNWGIPKGQVKKGEDKFETAKREFYEETGINPPENKESYTFLDLDPLPSTKSGKKVSCWMFKASGSEKFKPPKEFYMDVKIKGRTLNVPECDRGEYFPYKKAIDRIIKYQLPFIEEARKHLNF